MTYEFIYEFMYMKNIVKSYLNLCVPRIQMEGKTGRRQQSVPVTCTVDSDSTVSRYLVT